MTHTILRFVTGALAGAAAWFSLGVLAIVGDGGDGSAVGLLPPLWGLAALGLAGGIAALRIRGVSTGLLLLPTVVILPWLGVPGPASLLWTGPCTLVIWALVITGALRPVRWPRLSARAQIVAVAVAAIACAGAFRWSAAPAGVGGDEPHYLLISNSLLLDADVDLANDYEPSRHGDFYAGVLEPQHTILTPAGKHYSFHGPGVAFLVLPGFAAAGLTGARVVLIGVTALGLVALWSAIRVLTPSTAAAWAGMFALLLQLPFLAQSSAIYPDGAGAAVTSLTLLTLVRLEAGLPVSASRLAWSGAALSLLPWLHIRLSLLAIVFGVALAAAVWRREKRLTPLLWILAVPLAGAVAFFASALVMFETLDPTAPFRQKAAGSLVGAPSGALGLLVDHEYGLLVYAPVMAFAILGVIPCARRSPITAWSSVAAIAGTWLTAASFVWWAGTSAPARFLVPVLPAMALWLAIGWPGFHPTRRLACVAALAVAAVLTTFGAWADRGRYVATIPDGRLTIYEWANSLVSLPDSLPSWFRPGANITEEALIAGVWAASALALLWLARRIIATRVTGAGEWAVIAWCVVIWVSTATTAAWMIRGVDPRTLDRAQLVLLQASATPWLHSGWMHRNPFGSRESVLQTLAFRARPEGDEPTLLHAPRVPAGRYQIEVLDTGPSTPDVPLTLEVGREAWPLRTWPLRAPDQAPSLTLVMPVHSVRVTTSSADVASAVTVRLRVLGGDVVHAAGAGVAERVTRYGTLMVYSLDRASVMQTGQFWFSADRRGAVVIARDDGASPSISLTVEAGAMPVDVTLTRGDWRKSLSLEAGQREPLELPFAERPTALTIEVHGGDRRGPAVSIVVQGS